MSRRSTAARLPLLLLLGACAPTFAPRHVPIPPDCERVIQALVEQGPDGFDERTAGYAEFCQQQHLLRAEEEQAALARLEAEQKSRPVWFAPLSLGIGLLLVLVAN